jgi:hypothetical protein
MANPRNEARKAANARSKALRDSLKAARRVARVEAAKAVRDKRRAAFSKEVADIKAICAAYGVSTRMIARAVGGMVSHNTWAAILRGGRASAPTRATRLMVEAVARCLRYAEARYAVELRDRPEYILTRLVEDD